MIISTATNRRFRRAMNSTYICHSTNTLFTAVFSLRLLLLLLLLLSFFSIRFEVGFFFGLN